MTLAVYLAAAVSAVVFVVACAWRAWLYARSPLHLRWELYPVPHEAPERAAHGGSYFEQGEWWRHPRSSNLAGELRVMLPEILFLHALRCFNRPLWYRSFPFHVGLYLLAGALALVCGAAAAGTAAPTAAAWLGRVASVAGVAGLVSCVAGAAGLLHRRVTDPALRVSTTPGDIFNLCFFIVSLALLGVGYAARPAGAPGATAVVSGLASWDLSLRIAPAFGLGLVGAALLGAYIPLTHMAHFIAKYFTYHAVRWDDEPLRDNAARASAMAHYLTFRPTWRAPHVGADGSRTWADVVAANPAQEPRR